MTKKLKQAQQELQHWSNTLEEKVKEKTAELENAQRQMIFVEKIDSMGKLAAVVPMKLIIPCLVSLLIPDCSSKIFKRIPRKRPLPSL